MALGISKMLGPITETMVLASRTRGGGGRRTNERLADVPVAEEMIPGSNGAPDVRLFVINAQRGTSRPGIRRMHRGRLYPRHRRNRCKAAPGPGGRARLCNRTRNTASGAAGLLLFFTCLSAVLAPLAMGALGDAMGDAAWAIVLGAIFATLLVGQCAWNFAKRPFTARLAQRNADDYSVATSDVQAAGVAG